MNAQPATIHLHAGAHKTATTHLQVLLRLNKPYLAQAGVGVATPPELETWMRDFRWYQRLPAWARWTLNHRLKQAASNEDCWLFSEENFAGHLGELLSQPVLFSGLPARLTAMQRLFPEARITLFFAIRSYDSFLLSNYLELIRARGYFPWEQFHDQQRMAGYSWLEMFDRVTKVISPESIVLWRFEDFREAQGKILGRLTGTDDPDALLARYQNETTRPSLSARAVEHLRSDRTPKPGSPEYRAYVVDLNARFPAGDEHPRPQPWEPGELKALQARYERDVSTIRERYPSIEFLSA